MQNLPATFETPARTHEFKLDNGLRIIVREDHRAPVVTSLVSYHVGASHEPPGLSGMSHALEHLLFEGSAKLDAGQARKVYQYLGARSNANTGHDATMFHQTLAKDRLEVVLEIAADLMTGATLSRQAFAAQMNVIKAERAQQVDSIPHALAMERFLCQAFVMSAYRTPLIGWGQDLEQLTVESVRQWYQQWYTPNNATVVVVGDVDPQQVLEMCQRHFASIPARALPISPPPRELPAPGRRKTLLRLPGAAPCLYLALNVPTHATYDNPRVINALRLIPALMTDGLSARINQRLLRGEELLSAPRMNYLPFSRGDTVLHFSAQPNQTKGVSLLVLEKAVLKVLRSLVREPVTQVELDRARTRLIASTVYEQDAIQTQAHRLAQLAAASLPLSLLQDEVEMLMQVTPADITQAVRAWVNNDHLSIAHILPKETPHV